jgi:histidinol-phosphate aminotransferase
VTVRVRPAVAALPSYVAGKAAPTGLFKLSSNENPYPPLPGVLAATELACQQMNRYPDFGNVAVTSAVAARLGVDEDQLGFAAGSVAVLYHLLQAVCEPADEVIFAWRSFEAYPIAVQLTGATPVPVPLAPGAVHDLAAMQSAVTPATRAILLCSPNNPTGPALEHDAVVELVETVPDHILIMLDEAYVEFVSHPRAVRGLELQRAHRNVAVLRTFSKAYGLAGFRIGYCIADPEVARAARIASLPFGVSVPAQAAAVASLDAEEELMARVTELVKARGELHQGLVDLGFDVPDAQGNFVWLPSGDRTSQHAAAFTAGGVMVRPFAPGGAGGAPRRIGTAAGEPGDGIRITVGEREANELVLRIAATLQR